MTFRRNPSGDVVAVEMRDRREAAVISEERIVCKPTGGSAYDAIRVSEQISLASQGAAEIYEYCFIVDICLRYLSELPREYTIVWVECM